VEEASKRVRLWIVGELLVATPVKVNRGDTIVWRPPERVLFLFPEPKIFEPRTELLEVDVEAEAYLIVSKDAPIGVYPYAIYRPTWRGRTVNGEDFELSEHAAFAIGGSHPRIRIA
jgi:hypothetical protein